MAGYAENLRTAYGTPSDLNPNEWPVDDDGWHVQPSSGIRIRWEGGGDLYLDTDGLNGDPVAIGDGVSLGIPSYIGEGVRIGPNTTFGNTVYGYGNTYIEHHCVIGSNCQLPMQNAGIYAPCVIEDGVVVMDDTNIGNTGIASGWTIGADCTLRNGVIGNIDFTPEEPTYD